MMDGFRLGVPGLALKMKWSFKSSESYKPTLEVAGHLAASARRTL